MKRKPKTTTYQCYINADWRETGLARVTIAYESGKRITVASFLVDIFCLGVKNAMSATYRSWKFFEMMELFLIYFDAEPEPISFQLACDAICGSVAYAESLGFEPHPDFFSVGMFLPKGNYVPHEKISFGGPDGKPLYVIGPNDPVDDIIQTLETHLGKDGFDVVHPFDE